MGLVSMAIAVVLCEFVSLPDEGHVIKFEDLPASVQAISKERPGFSINDEQWRRINKEMEKSGGWPSNRQIFRETVRVGWYWFFLLPVLCLFLMHFRSGKIAAAEGALVFAPGFCLLLLAVW